VPSMVEVVSTMNDEELVERMRILHARSPVSEIDPKRQLALGRRARRRTLYGRAAGGAGAVVALVGAVFFVGAHYDRPGAAPGGSGSESSGAGVAIVEAYIIAPTAFRVNVTSCNGEPSVQSLIETAEEIRLLVVSDKAPSTNECLDTVTVELQSPIGERRLVDEHSGETIPFG